MVESEVRYYDIISNRLDAYYYNPSFVALENTIRKKNASLLKHYIKYISSGATPKRDDAELYGTVENGVPFLRVQNITEYGLNLEDVKYISKDVHNGLLKRTQLHSGDLLITITGRLGSAAVVPEGFIGNINQHSVKIETENFETSQIIAAYLNTSIAQKLILRRASGGTRPALDYFALKNIPIVFDKKICSIMQHAYKEKQAKEHEAKVLLAGIDDYLLEELGIELPENVENERYFEVNILDLIGGRLDVEYYNEKSKYLLDVVGKSKFELQPLYSITSLISNGRTPASYEYSETETEYPIIKAGSYTNDEINLGKVGYCQKKQTIKVKQNDIFILAAAHQAEYVGKQIKLLSKQPQTDTSFVGELLCVRANEKCNPVFLFNCLQTMLFKQLINREKRGQTSHIYPRDIKNIAIPFPSIDRQDEIAEYIQGIRAKAKRLQEEAREALERAKREVEREIEVEII